MSFSSETKKALCASFIKKDCCARALLFGLLRFSGMPLADGVNRLHSKQGDVLHLADLLLERCLGIHAALLNGCKKTDGTEGAICLSLAAADAAKIRRFCDGQAPEKQGDMGRRTFAREACSSCKAHFLRGVFLMCGSISQPRRLYQLDFKPPDGDAADILEAVLKDTGIRVKSGLRKGTPVLYCKESESIEDFLTLIGATKAAFAVMDTKIVKEIRNNVNRISNCEVANLEKSVEAADSQMKAIVKLEASGLLERISPQLRTTARLRLENPEASLSELAGLHSPPLTKSGLNHRLQKLISYANEELK